MFPTNLLVLDSNCELNVGPNAAILSERQEPPFMHMHEGESPSFQFFGLVLSIGQL